MTARRFKYCLKGQEFNFFFRKERDCCHANVVVSKLSVYLSNERSISKRGSNFCAQVELLIIRYIWVETCKPVGRALKMSILSLYSSCSPTLAHRTTVSPPYRSSSEHATGSEDRGGFREWHQRCGWCCGALRHTHRRRAFGQRCLG